MNMMPMPGAFAQATPVGAAAAPIGVVIAGAVVGIVKSTSTSGPACTS